MPTRRTFDKAEFLPNDNSTPHIVPGVLYPAIGGKLLDGTTSHSGDYGTSQTDSRKYYYTDIKGSKPIRDPRIGAHFGSQRHKFKSLQLLEQETATHGSNVYSVDGRENMRCVGEHYQQYNSGLGQFILLNRTNYSDNNGHFLEVTGYFSDVNFIQATWSDVADGSDVYIDGTVVESNRTARTSVGSPLESRYVDSGSVFRAFDTSQTLGIHTLKYTWVNSTGTTNAYQYHFGIELIAQDTTNAVTRNKIQIPNQTVFSFGSKFTVGGSSAATHYDPFSAKSDGTGWTSPTSGTNNPNSSAEWPSNIDTATSLGLAKWVDGTNYYRPYNGGRVVKWVDENGEIKTSVTVMPPNAKSIADSGTLSNATAKSNGSAPNDNFRPTFEAHTSSVDEDLLSEVAKTFHWREFGNGSANGGTGATYADASMLYGVDDIAYVMDDGLTSMAGDDVESSALTDLHGDADGDGVYITFIGTGITIENTVTSAGIDTIAQNLFYGTHILKYYRDSGSAPEVVLDGVTITTSTGTYGEISEITFHQPKMPPIPEGACIIADYMLMADFVPQTAAGNDKISKGVRKQSNTRDIFFESTDNNTLSLVQNVAFAEGFNVSTIGGDADSDTSVKLRIPSFGSNYVARGYQTDTRLKLFIDDTDNDSNATRDNTNGYGSYSHLTNNVTLGVNNFGVNFVSGTNGAFSSFEIVTPIHTSHHYTPFETPYLHELIGGDRNMEHAHLICSADGKTWDEVTRDTSYIGPVCVIANEDTAVTGTGVVILKDWRGVEYTNRNYFNKDFAIAYDRVICLVDGFYNIVVKTAGQGGLHVAGNLYINGVQNLYSYPTDSGTNAHSELIILLKRGDYIQVYGKWNGDALYNNFMITRVK